MDVKYHVVCDQRCDQLIYDVDTYEHAIECKKEMESWGYMVRIIDTNLRLVEQKNEDDYET